MRGHTSEELFATDIWRTSTSMSFRNLRHAVPGAAWLHHRVRPDGREILGCRAADLPRRYQLAICQFRFAQFMHLNWLNMNTAMNHGGFCEPGCHSRTKDLHVLALGPDGRLEGYVTAVPSDDAVPTGLRDPHRSLFAVEATHKVRVLDRIPTRVTDNTHEIWEIKRLLHRQDLTGSSTDRLRLSVELLLGLFTSLAAMRPAAAWIVGDAEENVAIRHLRMTTRDVIVIDGTTPTLSPSDLYAPAYERRDGVKPFLGRVPSGEDLRSMLRRLEASACATNRDRMKALIGPPQPLERIRA